MTYETNIETSIRKTDVFTFFIGKEIEPDETDFVKPSNKPMRKQQIENKKEVVQKLIKFIKNA